MAPSHLVLVTGAAGFLGRHTVSALRANGRRVVAVDQKFGVDLEGVEAKVQTNLADPSILADFTKGEQFSLIHLAWPMNRSGEFSDQAAAVATLGRLADWCAASRCLRVIGLGSAEEYGDRAGCLNETDAPGEGLSPYGWAKHAVGTLLTQWSARTGIPVFWMRPFIVYGPGQTGDMMIPYAVRMARERKEAQFTDGLQQRDLVHVEDIARALVRALECEPQRAGVYNLGSGCPVRVKDVLERIASKAGARDLFHLGARARRCSEPDTQYADIGKAKEQLNWEPSIRWEDGIDGLV